MSIRIIQASDAGSLLERRSSRLAEAEALVRPILEDVRTRGDEALIEYARRFDDLEGTRLDVDPSELSEAAAAVAEDFRSAIEVCKANIERFARLQMPKEFLTELGSGHRVGQIVRPLQTVVCYVPGGRYPLPSTVLMTAIPALVAGVSEVWITTPKANRETYATAAIAGVHRVARLGGAHAIAAFAYGTESIPKADRIVGPGNVFVTAAKKLLAGEVGIDFTAGPTEVLIIANEGDPAWIAADLLAQAEHDSDAASFLVTTNHALAEAVSLEVDRQLAALPSAPTAAKAIEGGSAILLVESNEQAVELSDRIAPEHLCLHDPELVRSIRHAGSVFLGPFSPEAAGDYATGPNHVLPTGGSARLHGGLSVLDFVKVITVQQLSEAALSVIAPAATTIARAEGLEAHARSIEVRTNARA